MLNTLLSLSPQMSLHGRLQNLIKWESMVWCISVWAVSKWKKDCEATVGVSPFLTQIFDLSPFRLSLQLQQLPPQRGHSWSFSSFRLITGCSSFLNSLFELPNASFLHLEVWDIGSFVPLAVKPWLQIATLMTPRKPANSFVIVQQGVSCSCWPLVIRGSE